MEKKILSYRPSYRSIAFCSHQSATDPVQFYFADGSSTDSDNLDIEQAPFLQWTVQSFQKFARKLERPWAVVHGDYFAHREWSLPDAQIGHIQKMGLNIFMYEPLFIYNEDRSWPWNSRQGPPRYYELEAVCDFARKNHIISPITVFLGEYDLGLLFRSQGLFPQLEFKNFNTYFQEAVEIELKYKWPTLPPEKITHKYISMNFRYEPIREMLTGFLLAKNYAKDGFTSFYHSHDNKEFTVRLPFDAHTLEQWPTIDRGIDKLQTVLPLVLDAKNAKVADPVLESIPDISGTHNIKNMGEAKNNFFPKSFMFLYCESRPFSPRSEISEKSLQPLFSKKPFLVFAGPYFLKQLRDLGFQTFSDFWDESYDEIEDPKLRFEAFLRTVDFILKKDIHELRQILSALQPRLEHNHTWITKHAIQHQQDRLLNDLDLKSNTTQPLRPSP